MTAALLSQILVYAFGLWAIAATAKLLVYLALSLDDFSEVVIAAVLHASVALWFLPALLLLSAHSHGESAFGILLVANTARVLMAQPVPRTRRVWRVAEAKPKPWSFVLGAVLLQSAFCAWWWGYAVASAGLLTVCVCLWTSAYLNSGVNRQAPRPKPLRSALNIALTLLVTIALAASQLRHDGEGAEPQGLLQTSQQITARFSSTPQDSGRVARKVRTTKVASVQIPNGVPGVILRPKEKSKEKATAVAVHAFHFSVARPVTFRFTGEYRVFPVSSGSAPFDSEILTGTPLDQVYGTVSGSLVATEAYQRLDPPFDFTPYSKIQLGVRSGEDLPVGAELQLIANSAVVNLGTEVFNLPPAPEATVNFAVKRSEALTHTTALRIIFRRLPAETSHSTRVDITGVTLTPR